MVMEQHVNNRMDLKKIATHPVYSRLQIHVFGKKSLTRDCTESSLRRDTGSC